MRSIHSGKSTLNWSVDQLTKVDSKNDRSIEHNKPSKAGQLWPSKVERGQLRSIVVEHQ